MMRRNPVQSGQIAPRFYRQKWIVLFSHLKEFMPVGIAELG
jgi:alkyl hydroperoxide reductase subunit AhpC